MHIELIERPRARNRDPVTSFEAAKKAERFAKSHAGRILAVFQSNATFTWTAHELAIQTGLSVVQIDRRLNEMPQIERAGFALDGFTAWRLRAQEPCYFTVMGEKARDERLSTEAAQVVHSNSRAFIGKR